MRAALPLTLVLTFACSKPGSDDSTDTDTSADTDVTPGEDTDVAADTDVPADTDVAQGDEVPPEPQIAVDSDYTVYFDGAGLNIYWRDALDDVTATSALEYKVSCLSPGAFSPVVTMDWTVATSLTLEGSGRYWVPACAGEVGSYVAYVTVRDEAHNEADFPQLSGEITVGGPK